MHKTIIPAHSLDGFVRLDLGKGCVLKLRSSDYYAGIEAGKAERQAQTQTAREAQGQGAQGAQALAWIDTDAPDRL